jgi:hypothetical protein
MSSPASKWSTITWVTTAESKDYRGAVNKNRKLAGLKPLYGRVADLSVHDPSDAAYDPSLEATVVEKMQGAKAARAAASKDDDDEEATDVDAATAKPATVRAKAVNPIDKVSAVLGVGKRITKPQLKNMEDALVAAVKGGQHIENDIRPMFFAVEYRSLIEGDEEPDKSNAAVKAFMQVCKDHKLSENDAAHAMLHARIALFASPPAEDVPSAPKRAKTAAAAVSEVSK